MLAGRSTAKKGICALELQPAHRSCSCPVTWALSGMHVYKSLVQHPHGVAGVLSAHTGKTFSTVVGMLIHMALVRSS